MFKKNDFMKIVVIMALLTLPLQMLAQITIRGTITDENKVPMPGVNIIQEGTGSGTITDLNGKYSIDVDGDKKLVFSFVGYQTLTVPVQDREVIDINMRPATKGLEEVVVVGYGTQKKSDLTGAVVKVEGKDLKKLPVTNLDQALQGRASGVWITQSSDPGGTAKVHIRGLGTTNINQPLYVVDGIPLATPDGSTGYLLNDINPSDIESIEVLKDAAATAIYGARAANGVVLITTKKGKAGQVTIDVESYYGVQNLTNKIDVLDRAGYVEYIEKLYGNVDRDVPNSFTSNPDIANTDWQDEYYRQGVMQNYYLSASGGNKNAVFNISGGYLSHKGIKIGNDFKRMNLRVNSEANKGRLRFGENLNITRTTGRFPGGPALREANPTKIPPVMPLKCDDCVGGWGHPTPELTGESTLANPVAMATYKDLQNEGYRILGNIYAQVEILKGLSYKLSLGGDYSASFNDSFEPRIDMGISKYTRLGEPALSKNTGKSRQWIVENLITYKREFEKHSIDVVVGHTAEKRHSDNLGINVQGFKVDNIHPVSEADTVLSKSGYKDIDYAILSYLGRINYAFNDKYLLSVSLRRDGTTRFHEDYRFGIFPALSVGWKISNEPFMEAYPVISFLKLRASWGQAGNQDIGSNFAYLSQLGWATRYAYGNTQNVAEAYATWNLANHAMQWETSEQLDAALEIGLLDNRFFMIVDYYRKKTKDMLLEVPIPYYSGVWREFPYLNTGEVLNSGFEFEISYKNNDGKLKYQISTNLTTINNEVLSIGNKTEPIYNNARTTRTEVGSQIGEFYGWKTEGVFQNELHVESYNSLASEGEYYQQFSTQPGDIIFQDLNGDGTITDADRESLGSPIPDFLIGLNLNIAYKGLDMSMFLQGIYGNEILNFHKQALYDTHSFYNKHTDVLTDAWSGDGSSNQIPRIGMGDANQNNRVSDRYVEDGSFLRLKNIQIGYSLPETIINNVSIKRCRIYLSATNLITLTKYSGYDPEVGMGGWYSVDNKPALNKGIDNGGNPLARTFQAGFQLSF